MKIAVLMSTYNGHDYLYEQLKSLAQQTVAKDMIIYIRDDGSTDNTFEIIEKWKDKLSIVLYKEKNAGPAMSFWKLLMNPDVQADYYAFCDQDDVWDGNKIESGLKRLHGDIHLYACNCRIIDENGRTVREKRMQKMPEISTKRLFVSGCTQGCSMIFTDALRKYVMGMRLQCIPMHDVVLMLYALQFGKIFWDQKPHFGYRVHSNNVVAKVNKSFFQRLKTTYWNWKNSSKNSMADVASEMLRNIDELCDEEQEYLQCLSNYKHSIRCKKAILFNNKINNMSKNVINSYRIRIILGIY